jgi:hypothetical protein
MSAIATPTNSRASRGFSSRLRWALISAPLLILAPLVVEFYWRFTPLSVGGRATATVGALAAIVGSVSAVLGAYRLIRFPASRNIEAFVLTGINAPICVASLAFLAFKLKEPPSGSIAVKYDGVSASSVFLVVENQSTQAIYIRSEGDKVWPGYFRTACRTFGSEQSDPMVIVDGFYSTTKVAPGGRIRLDVPTELPKQFKDGHVYARCRVRLELEGGTFIETYDFEPK